MDVGAVNLCVTVLIVNAAFLSSIPVDCPSKHVWHHLREKCLPCNVVCTGNGGENDAVSVECRNRCTDETCGDYDYYHKVLRKCEGCNHICDNHGIQGYTEKCMNECPKYFARMGQTITSTSSAEPPATSTTPRPTTNHETSSIPPPPRHTDSLSATVIVLLVIVGLLLAIFICVVVLNKDNIKRMCREPADEATPTSSNDSDINRPLDSKEVLTRPAEVKYPTQEQHGRIRSPCETSAEPSYRHTFSQYGGVRYALLEQAMATDNSQSTYVKETASGPSSVPRSGVVSEGVDLSSDPCRAVINQDSTLDRSHNSAVNTSHNYAFFTNLSSGAGNRVICEKGSTATSHGGQSVEMAFPETHILS